MPSPVPQVSSAFTEPPTLPEEWRVAPALMQQLRHDVSRLLHRESPRFPGAQPVSFAARHLEELQKADYFVCEKSDGLRCLMYLTASPEGQEHVFLIDRKNDFYLPGHLHFPLPDNEQDFYRDTLVDGELVNDRAPGGGVVLRYLVFDCLALSGRLLTQRPLDKRLGFFRESVHRPHTELYRKYPEEKAFLPFDVAFKGMHRGYGIEDIFRSVLPKLAHKSDGLIFTCRTSPYRFGTDPHILKWKPADENSVDFRVALDFPLADVDDADLAAGVDEPYPDWSAQPTVRLFVLGDGGRHVPYGELFLEPHEWAALRARDEPLDHRIFECYMDDQRRWRFMRFRDDKTAPNHISVVENVIDSITDRIGPDDLIAAQAAIRDRWKEREAEAAREAKLAAANGRAPSRG